MAQRALEMSAASAIEIFTLITGIIFILMQIVQHKWMWYFDIISGAGALLMALLSSFWANALLQAYFIVMAVVGMVRWRRIRNDSGEDGLHVVKLSSRTAMTSAALAIIGGAVIWWILRSTSDPSPVADAASFILSIIATWWLACAYKEEWLLWLVADGIAVWMYASQSHWGMAVLYVCYVISCIAGFLHWKRKGKVVS